MIRIRRSSSLDLWSIVLIGLGPFLLLSGCTQTTFRGGSIPVVVANNEVRANPSNGNDIEKTEEPKPDLVTSIRVSETTAPHQDVSISTTVKNIGSIPAPESFSDVVVRNARPPRQVLKKFQETIRELDPGDSFTFSISVEPGLGMYEVCAYADAKKSIDESDEINNRSCAMIEGK
jgi:subtilase family serine protease